MDSHALKHTLKHAAQTMIGVFYLIQCKKSLK